MNLPVFLMEPTALNSQGTPFVSIKFGESGNGNWCFLRIECSPAKRWGQITNSERAHEHNGRVAQPPSRQPRTIVSHANSGRSAGAQTNKHQVL